MEHLSDKFKYEQKDTPQSTVIQLKGFIDEDTNFAPLLKLTGTVVFNFKEVTGINSLGIRGWVNFLKELGDIHIHYEECPPLIVRQMNMIPSFVGTAAVDSVYVPYVCESCEAESLVLSTRDDFKATPPKVMKTFTCTKCQKGEMEIDGSPQQYFAFSR